MLVIANGMQIQANKAAEQSNVTRGLKWLILTSLVLYKDGEVEDPLVEVAVNTNEQRQSNQGLAMYSYINYIL